MLTAAFVLFTAAMGISLWVLTSRVDGLFETVAVQAGRTSAEQAIAARRWNAGVGGVYVPLDKGAIPNPYLKDPTRDITSVEGIALTKVNPAYMTRLIAETLKAKNGVQLHLTSLKPMNPGNVPDEFERSALRGFEGGGQVAWTLTRQGQDPIFRYMEPLKTDQACLACHAEQGYKLGSIRGGIAVSFTYRPYAETARDVKRLILLAHFFAYLFGVALLAFVALSADSRRRA